MLKEVFEKCDTNNSGQLTENELSSLSHSALQPFSNWLCGGPKKKGHEYMTSEGGFTRAGIALAIHAFCCEEPRFLSQWAEAESRKREGRERTAALEAAITTSNMEHQVP